MVISRLITRNLRSTVFSLHRQELMAVTTLLPVYKQWVLCSNQEMVYPIPFTKVFAFSKTNEHYYMNENVAYPREVSIQSIGTDSMSCYRYGTKTSVILIGV